MFALTFAFVAALAMGAFSVNVNAATFVVNTTNDTADAAPGNGTCADAAGACSLRAAISEANALAGADTITIPAGTYTQSLAGANEDANAGGDLDITSPVTINGAAAATTIIQGNAAPNTGTERVFHVIGAGATAVTINNVTIENGKALDATDGGRGAGIKVDGQTINFSLTNSTVRNNFADTRGGGISINKGNLTVTGCTFTGNVAGSAFGTGGAGGAILVDSQDNVAVPGQVATITNTVMNANKAESSVANTFGGAVIVRALGATVTITGCTVTNNISNATGAFTGFAGGLYNQQATMNVIDTVVSGNTASSFHAGIRNLASTAAAASLNVTRSTISNNSSAAATGQGGGITNILGGNFDATVSIDHSTISGNTLTGATSVGGGLMNVVGAFPGLALMSVANSTVSGNSAADIGGIYSDGATATTIIDFSTISNNIANNATAPEGGGVYQDTTAGGTTFLSNSISANNVAGTSVDVNDLVTSLDYNHIENPNPAFVPAANDVVGSDPNIGPLGNNGGPTQTHPINAGSPVLNTIPNGTNGCGNPINDDQRGVTRPQGAACDKGSNEGVGSSGGPTPTFTNTPAATFTNTSTNTATNTPTPTATVGPTFTSTNTPVSTFTSTNTATSTNTPTPTATTGPTFTSTNTPVATFTSTNTPTATATTAPPTGSPTCTPAANVIADGGFETGGIPSTIWNSPQTSTNFGTPLCDAACGNGAGASPPRTGSIWAWFGGATSPETATLGQNVVIPSGGGAQLRFWMRIGTVTAPFSDVLNVKVDNVTVQTYTEPATAEGAYTERVIDLSAFANGASHNITFEYIGTTTGTGSFTIDDVTLLAGGNCIGTPTSTPTSTGTPTNTATATATATPPVVQSFANTTPVCTTLGTIGAPYPSTITVAGGPTQIGDMRVAFLDFWHQLPDNFDALLVGPQGQRYVIMGDAGGTIAIAQNASVDLTFADFLPVVLPDAGPLVTGTTEPTTWESPVTIFQAPAPPGPYVEAGNQPLGPIGTTLRGTFGFTNANGVWSLYVRDDAGAAVNPPNQITGCMDGGWRLDFVPLTAAPASISGRVITASGHGIRNAKIIVTGGALTEPVVVTTGSMGYYSLDGLATGQTYVVTVNSRRYNFSMPSRVISLVDNVADADFVANPE